MQEKIVIPNKKDLSKYDKYNISAFLLPLCDYSIGCEVYFTVDEINHLSEKYKVYVYMNKFLHKDIEKFREIYNSFNISIKFICEEIGLINIIDKDRFVLYENHILSNYKAINFLYENDISNVVVNNDLTIDELKTISKKVNSNMYYFYCSKNMIMYSRRNLVSNYFDHFKYGNKTDKLELDEKTTHMKLDIMDEKCGSTLRYSKIFCASKYINDLSKFNLIYDFNGIDELNESIILENMDNPKLCDLIDSDYYFLEHEIKYKVGDL